MSLRPGRALLLAFAVAGAVCGRAGAAVPGHALSVESRCNTGLLSIIADASLSGAVDIQGATSAVGSGGQTVDVSAACGDAPLTLRVPPDFPVNIDAAGSGTVRLGDLRGPVMALLRDDVALEAGRLDGPVNLALHGGGDAHVGALNGPTLVSIFGSSDLRVDSVDTKAFALTDTGSGDVAIGGGQIDALKATLSGSGDLRLDGTVRGGEVVTAGSGDVSIARVLGSLVEVQTGSGEISIRDRGDRGGGRGGATPARSDHRGVTFSLGPLAVLPPVAVVLLAILLLRRRRQGRAPTPSGSLDPRVEAAVERLTGLSRRIGRMEALVTSREFELERRFRDLGR